MSLSDILTILGLIAAIIAFVSEKNREYLFLKFSIFDLTIFITSFLLINYLIAFDWFKEKGWYSETLMLSGWPLPPIWAYFITLSILAYLFHQTYYGFFPSRHKDKVIAYYRNQLIKAEFSFLISLIEKFHQDDVVEFLRRLANSNPPSESRDSRRNNDSNITKLINTNRLKYASHVYSEIITNETFIDNTVNTHPYFFTDFICNLSSKQLANEDFVYRYLTILIENNNYHLIRELKNNRNYSQNTIRYRLPEENKILRSFFINIKVAEFNHGWQPYGKLTCKYLEEESEKKLSLLREIYKGGDEHEFWSFRIYQAIWFFDIMIREAIAQDTQSHMWLFYFHHFLDGLIENMPDESDAYSLEDNIPSRNHYFVHEIISVMCSWIQLMREMNKDKQMQSTADCLGRCLYSIAFTHKLSEVFVVYCFDTVLKEYFDLSNYENTEAKRSKMEEFFIKPIMGFNSDSNEFGRKEYKNTMKLAWSKFDKVPYEGHEDNGSIQQFESNVLTHLN